MRTNEEIVRILKEEKDRQGLSISELARRVDMAKSAVSRYFNYTREFPLNRADDFARVLGISTDYLLGISKGDSDKLENEYPIIEKTVETMKKLDEPRQKVVLEIAKEQHEQQEKEKVVSLKDYRLTDEYLEDQVNKGVAYGGKQLSDNDKEFFKKLLKKTLEERMKRGE